MSIGTLIKTIQDIMRKDVGVDGDAQRISQIVWLLFLKIFDDKEQEWQLTIPGYKSPLQTRFRWSNWAKDAEGITGEELIDFVNNELFPSLKKLATSAGVTPHGKVVGSVFEDAYNYMKSGTLLRQVINTIEDDVDFNSSTDRHLFNDIYEKSWPICNRRATRASTTRHAPSPSSWWTFLTRSWAKACWTRPAARAVS